MYGRQICGHCRCCKRHWIIFSTYWILRHIHLKLFMISSLIGQDLSGKTLVCRILLMIKQFICTRRWYHFILTNSFGILSYSFTLASKMCSIPFDMRIKHRSLVFSVCEDFVTLCFPIFFFISTKSGLGFGSLSIIASEKDFFSFLFLLQKDVILHLT